VGRDAATRPRREVALELGGKNSLIIKEPSTMHRGCGQSPARLYCRSPIEGSPLSISRGRAIC
jgi:hypothetical protein